MKMRIIKLRPDFLMKTLRGKTNSFVSNLPDDTELLDIKYDLFSNQVLAVIRSNSFEDIPESYPIEEFTVAYTPEFPLVYAAAAKEPQLNIGAKTQAVTAVNRKPEAQYEKETIIQPSPDTSGVEEEFTPEQRQLLSFTVEGEYVIVKPTQYLKAEWDDINAVVKSLGGRWVKSDVGSRWEIPRLQSQQK